MKTRNLLETTIPVMYHNGMTDLADFLKVMASMHVEGEDLQFATQIFMNCAAEQAEEEEELVQAEYLSTEEKTEACEALTKFFVDQEIGIGDAIEVAAATLSNIILQMHCDEKDEMRALIDKTTDDAIEMLVRHLAETDRFPGLIALRLIALRVLHITSKKELIEPLVERALEHRVEEMAADFVEDIFGDEECDNDCEGCGGCHEEETEDIEIEADIKVRMGHKLAEMFKEAGASVCGGVLAVNTDDLPSGFEAILEKASKKGIGSLSDKEQYALAAIIAKAITTK